MEELFFDASSIEPAGSFDPLPAGDYEVEAGGVEPPSETK